MQAEVKPYTIAYDRKDFVTDQHVRWCPGCGDFMILATMQKVFANLGKEKEKLVCVSGIGCSSRITYYMETYGIHSIHGRAVATASGVKLANPDLSVWVATGDGDCMAIGGNHFIHAVRRNIDLNIIVFNNKIYGMTKGQTSPTSPEGLKTKSSPDGVFERPFNIGEVAIGCGASFFARVPDKDYKMLEETMHAAYKHKGTSVIEVLQNCVIYTDGIHEQITGKEYRDDNQTVLKHGETIRFGKDDAYGLVVDGMKLKKVRIDEGMPEDTYLKHDMHEEASQFHLALARMQLPDFPVATGIIRDVEEPSYDERLFKAIDAAKKRTPFKNTTDLFMSGNTWTV